MAFASGGSHGLYYAAESVFGVTPTNPNWIPFRHTSCSLQLKRDNFTSKELRADRAITDVRLGTYKVEGDVGIEISYGAFDTMLEALLGGTWTANVLKQGIVQRSFSILRRFTDIGQYQVFSGCSPTKLTLDVKPNGMTTGTFSFVGSNMDPNLPAGSSYAAASTNTPMDSFSSAITLDGVSQGVVTALTVTLDNGIDPNFVIGSKTTPQLSWGRATATGKLTAFFQDLAMMNRFVNETATVLQFITAAGGQSLTWLLDNVKFTAADNAVSDEKPVNIDMTFSALHDPTYTCLQITRAPGSPSPSASPSRSPSVSPSASPSHSISPSASPSVSPS